jgi:hypothetical protein
MALYLIHMKMDGEPIGAWNDAQESVYAPGHEDAQDDGLDTISIQGTAVPWSVFADRLARGTNFQEWWSTIDVPGPLEQALSEARTKHFTAKDAATPTDR